MAPTVIPALRSLWWGDVKIQVKVQRNFEGTGTQVYSVFIMIMILSYVKVCVSEGGSCRCLQKYPYYIWIILNNTGGFFLFVLTF